MITLIVSVGLYLVCAGLIVLARQRRGNRAAIVAFRRSLEEIKRLLPRLLVGIVGAGFLARLLPQDIVVAWLGEKSGILGLFVATLAGVLVPGGPVVGYSLGAAALKAGAGLPQVMAFVTAWAVYGLQRMLIWEVAMMPAWMIRLRVAVSLPLPILVGLLVMLISGGRP
jgi:uncharacterized membrane protein YraQ (UPF0718 family)